MKVGIPKRRRHRPPEGVQGLLRSCDVQAPRTAVPDPTSRVQQRPSLPSLPFSPVLSAADQEQLMVYVQRGREGRRPQGTPLRLSFTTNVVTVCGQADTAAS